MYFVYIMDSGKYASIRFEVPAELHSFEQLLVANGISLVDLISLYQAEEAREELCDQLEWPLEQCTDYINLVMDSVKESIRPQKKRLSQNTSAVSTGLLQLDMLLHNGIQVGSVTEVFGASGCGKSQLLLQIALEAQVKRKEEKTDSFRGRSIIISTESALETRRLQDMCIHRGLPDALDNISYTYCHDVENQDHIIFTQLPAMLDGVLGKDYKVVIIDSISHHFRDDAAFINALEYLRSHLQQQEEKLSHVPEYNVLKEDFDRTTNQYFKGNAAFRKRVSKKYYLLTLYTHLSDLAKKHNVAVVVSNQVGDSFDPNDQADDIMEDELNDPLNFQSQVGTFSGWNAQSMHRVETEVDKTKLTSQTSNEGTTCKRQRLAQEEYRVLRQNSQNPQLASGPKKKIEALGYTWSKLVPTKILLWKSYLPLENMMQNIERKEGTLLTQQNSENPPYSQEVSSTDTLQGWILKRYARVISNSNTYNLADKRNCVAFSIVSEGLCEVAD